MCKTETENPPHQLLILYLSLSPLSSSTKIIDGIDTSVSILFCRFCTRIEIEVFEVSILRNQTRSKLPFFVMCSQVSIIIYNHYVNLIT